MKILLVEDSPSDAMLLEMELRETASECVIERTSTLAAAQAALATGAYNLVLLDLGLPDSDGIDTFAAIAESAPRTAIVVLSGSDNQDMAEKAVLLGAQDYLVKGTTPRGRMARTLSFAIRRHQILDDLDTLRGVQLEQKDRFLSHVSHELRSPLAVIHQFVSLMSDGIAGPLTDEQRDYLEVTTRNINQLRSMVDDLLDIGRLDRGNLVVEPTPTQLGNLLTDCVGDRQPLAAERSITLTVTVPPLPPVLCDPRLAAEVLGNLLDNALKFTPTGGRVDVGATSNDSGEVRVSVRDTGRGILPENIDRVFEQFFQEPGGDETARHGLGLGLFISRQMVERQGGRISVESSVGEGTTVTFTLPLAFTGS